MVFRICFLLAAFGAALLADMRRSVGLSVENRLIVATWNEDSQRVQLLHKPTGKIFVPNAELLGAKGNAELTVVNDETFGPGQAIRIGQPDGSSWRVELFPNLPFAVASRRMHNSGADTSTLNQISMAALEIDWGVDSKQLTTFGTGGVLKAANNPGSYAWLATVEPATRSGVVIGWITHDRGSGVLFSRQEQDKLFVDARLDYGRLSIESGESAQLEQLAIGFFEDARLGLEAWADVVATVYDIQLPEQPTGYCTWYSKPHGGASDEKHLAELSDFAAEKLASHGFSFVQIDDYWQDGVSTDGPRRNFTTNDPDGPYPTGMKAIADKIKSLDLTPGIWFMPFAGTHYDPFFENHQDWFVKTSDGKPYSAKWGGTSLDMTHPGAREHLRSVVERISREWGFEYFKIDGLWTGTATPLRYVNSGYRDDGIGDAVFHDRSKSNIEVYRDGLKLVREAAGPDVFILGCNGPQNMRSYGGAMGLLDAMRIGPDNGAKWKQLLKGPVFGSRHYFLHGRVWYNDPDPVYVRDSMPLKHAQLLCSWVAISGQLNASSEWLPGLPAERLDILQRTMPGHGLLPRPVDLFEHDPPRIWSLVDTRRQPHRNVVGLFNWEGEAREIGCAMSDLGLADDAPLVGYDYWNDELLPIAVSPLQISVPAESCRIISIRSASDLPQLISTSRHVTQGIMDVIDENWFEADRSLRGSSQLLGAVDYELRVVAPDSSWKAKSATAANAKGEPLSSDFDQQGQLIRVKIHAPRSGEITWSVGFGN